MNDANYMTELRAWHTARRRADLTAMFQLGDHLLRAVVHSGLTLGEVIAVVLSDLKELAYHRSIYYNAALVRRVFTRVQRTSLIKAGVSGVKAVNLAGKHYDKGNRRSRTIAEIKSGKLKPPWKCIRGPGTPIEIEPRRAAEVRENWHVITVPIYGPDEEIEDSLTSLLSQLGPDKFYAYYRRAVNRLTKSGQRWPRMDG